MIKGTSSRIALFALAATMLFGSCRKRDDIALADNFVIFTSDAQGMTESESSVTVNLKLSRPTDKEITVLVKLTPDKVVYGTDFTTTPAMTTTGADANTVKVIIPSGNNETSFKIEKVAGALFDGDEKIVFDLYSSASPVLIGVKKKFTLSFGELVATSASLVGTGGGATYPNKVFIDLSANRETPVLRTSWDLGFYTDASDFRVILNSSTAMMAKPIAKNDLNAVTAADTVGFGNELTIGSFGVNPATLPFIDYPNGDLTRTAFGVISATAADNKVFIVNRGAGVGSAPGRGWKKVRVLRNASGGYTLQYADIAATSFSTMEIAKDDNYFFKYISFETGAVNVEPQKKKWDIAWTYFTNTFGSGASEAPFMFQDIILQNRNVQVATVLVATKAFDAFTEADIAAQTFSTSQIKIGADWRTTMPAAAKADRYYIIKDGDNNYYKVKFTALTDNNGIRGNPALQSVLVKRG